MTTADLTEFVAQQQRRFDSATSLDERKSRGHFGTPPVIAQFMAGMFSHVPAENIRILDPGAGVGSLSAAFCQRVLTAPTPCKLFFELWENDPRLISILEETMRRCQQALRAAGHDMQFIVRIEDFILAHTQRTLFKRGPEPSFHLAILNPPYFKLRKDSPQAQTMQHVVHGQPNIYALFMAAAAELLLPDGEMVAITPRSYFNGPYFKLFRKWFFDRMATRQIHVFESRTEAFKDDEVLQENVILHASKGRKTKDVLVSSSVGRDMAEVTRTTVPYERVIDNSNGDQIIRVPATRFEHEIVGLVDALPCRFRGLGFEISTGPVVTFRSTEYLRRERSDDTAPLLWMHNVRPFAIRFPPDNGKPSHIEVSDSSKKLLVPSKTYVLLKRFTAKEEKRRLVAGIITRADSYSKWVGLENHVNYVYRKGSELTLDEAYGLAAFFNSVLVDKYFRAISGNTQVNATEIRSIPMPDQSTLSLLGERIRRLKSRDHAAIETAVGQALHLPRELTTRLVEVV